MKKMFGFGINNFADPSAALQGCVNDTGNIRKIFVDGPMKVDPKNVRLVCDERATRLAIYERLDWCTRGWEGPGDQLIIQGSCHGTQVVCRDGDEVGDNMDECLCPYDFPDLWDSPTNAPDAEACAKFLGRLPKPLMCDDDMAIFLKKIPSFVATAMIIDACHSGSSDREIRRGPKFEPKFVPAPFDIESRGLGRDLTVRKFGRKRGVDRAVNNTNVHYTDQRHILLSGCRDDQTSADANIIMPQGAMSWSFEQALIDLGYFLGKKPTWIHTHLQMLVRLAQYGFEQMPQLTGPEDLLNAPVFGAA